MQKVLDDNFTASLTLVRFGFIINVLQIFMGSMN